MRITPLEVLALIVFFALRRRGRTLARLRELERELAAWRRHGWPGR